MINGGLIMGGFFKCLKKSQKRSVNCVHMIPQTKHRKREVVNIVFLKEDAKGVKQPYDDPLVIMLTIEGFNIRRFLVDNGSPTDIIYLSAFQKLKVNSNRLRPLESPLVSFNGDRVYLKGIMILKVTTGTYP